jgi:hypothetical protein
VRDLLAGTTTAEAVAEQVAIKYSEEVRAAIARLALSVELGRRGLWMELRSVVNAQPPLLLAIDLLNFDSETVGLPAVAGSSEVLGLDVQAEDAQLSETIPHGDLEFPPPLPPPNYGIEAALDNKSDRGEINTILNAASVGGAQLVDAWRQYCQQNGLETAPEISPTVLDEVRRALRCATKPRFDVLHRHYRRQCLGLASVEVRMETVRLIAQRDKANPIWQDELQRLEVARVDELKRDLDTALANGEPNAAELILDHLQSAEWCDPHAARRVVVEFESRVKEAWGRFAHSHMQTVADEMFKHYMAEAVEQVEAQSSVWEHYCERLQRVGMAVPEGPAATVAPILDWLQRRMSDQQLQQVRHTARETLERLAVDSTASPTALSAALIEAERVGCDLPPTLRDVTDSRLRAHRLQQRNWRRVKVVLVGCAAAGLLAVSVWVVLTLLRQQRLEEFVSKLEAAVQRRDTPSVEQLSEDAEAVRDGFMSDPRAVAALERHEELLAKERVERENRIKEEEVAAEAAADKERRSTKFKTKLDELTSRIDDLERHLERQDMAITEARKTLDEVEGAVTRLGSESAGLGADASAAFTAQCKRVSTLRNEVDLLVRAEQERREEASQLKALDSAIDDPERFCRLLGAFAKRFPQSQYSSQFAEVAGQCGPQVAIVRWNETAAQIAGDPFPADEADRSRIRDFLESYRAENSTSPVDSAVRRYEELLADSEEWAVWLKNVIRTSPDFATKQVTLTDGSRFFYSRQERVDLAKGGEYSVWLSGLGDEKANKRYSSSEISSDDESPQFYLGEEIEKIITGRAARTDGVAALKVVQQIRDDTKVDPIFRVQLLSELLPQVQLALPYLKQEIGQCVGILGQLPLEGVNWTKPCVPEKRREHGRCVDALRLDVPVESWKDKQRQRMTEIREWVHSKMHPVGWIDSIDLTRSLRLGIGVRLQQGDSLFVVNDSGSLLQIGKVDANGLPHLDALARTQPSGSLVFAGTDRVPRSPKGAK